MESTTLGLFSPWQCFANEVEALFAKDPEVIVGFDDAARKTVRLYVYSMEKAEALSELLPEKVEFGNVAVYLEVCPSNTGARRKIDLFKAAFKGNGAVSQIVETDVIPAQEFDYVVFEPEVVQYRTDDLGDLNGYESTLYEDIARDVFGNDTENVYFCTDLL